ncbi:MAG: M48 family metalloprotease [Longimicrobiales bacterium]|nr:M48 family metalloprotease [Longimicrobiales bacterium]
MERRRDTMPVLLGAISAVRSRRTPAVAPVLALLAAFAASACAINPATGRNQLMLVSEDQAVAMGRQADTAIIATIGLYEDAAWQSYIQQFGERLAATSERPNLPWTFRVVDDPAVNAFAVPGGFVYVTRGLLAHLTSEAELASVVGHEIGHITARHSSAEMSKQQLFGVGLAIGSIASSTVAKYAGAANQALGVLYLKYSRDNESEADELGLRYLQRANYDPRQMSEVFVMLERASAAEGGGRLPEWLATHPSPGNRIAAITEQIAALPQDFSGTNVNRDSYLGRLDGLVFGVNPREGYFQGSRFLHPDMRFQLVFPEGWATQNGKQAVVAVSPGKDAVVELSPARETSADAAARAFLSQQGITGGATSRANLSGLATVSAPFGAETEGGALKGMVLFVEYRGSVFGLVGYAPDARWPTYQAAVERALRSFQPLTDPAALNVQPQHLDILKLDRRTTIEALAGQRSSPASAATLALINQVELQTPLASGQLVKWVIGPAQPMR